MNLCLFSARQSCYLSSNNPKFVRPGAFDSDFYYNAIQMLTNTTGTYTIKSRSLIDTYGCLYDQVFYPSNTSQNQIACDDDSAGSYQFEIVESLRSNRTYILVVTTSDRSVIGQYSIVITGSTVVNMAFTTSCSEGESNYLSNKFVYLDNSPGLLLK